MFVRLGELKGRAINIPAPAVAEGGAATEERLQAVCAMGFERAAAESALVAANGDVEGAIDLLLNAA